MHRYDPRTTGKLPSSPPAAVTAAADIGVGRGRAQSQTPRAQRGEEERKTSLSLASLALPLHSSFGDPSFSFMPSLVPRLIIGRRCCVVVKLLLLVLVMSYACFHLSPPPIHSSSLSPFHGSFVFYPRMTLQLIFSKRLAAASRYIWVLLNMQQFERAPS